MKEGGNPQMNIPRNSWSAKSHEPDTAGGPGKQRAKLGEVQIRFFMPWYKATTGECAPETQLTWHEPGHLQLAAGAHLLCASSLRAVSRPKRPRSSALSVSLPTNLD